VKIEHTGDEYVIRAGARTLRWSDFQAALESDPDFRSALTETLESAPHEGYFWECRPWPAEADPELAFVLVDAPALARRTRVDAETYRRQFDSTAGLVCSFSNLGRDARLVVPVPTGSDEGFGHLASWIRTAPARQIDDLWLSVAAELAAWRAADRGTVWLSTSGGGVAWVHVRLDSRPKYYAHRPYRSI